MTFPRADVPRVVGRLRAYTTLRERQLPVRTLTIGRFTQAATGAAPKPLASRATHAPAKTTSIQKTHRIVVVDDDIGFRESLCALLRSRGYPQPVACAGGQELLGVLMDTPFDLVLLDLLLPKLSGLDVLGMLRQSKVDVAVIVVSGDTMIESAIGALRLGADDYLRKPYTTEILLHTVEAVLQRRDMKKKRRQEAAELERSEHKRRLLVENSPDLIFTLDEQFNFVFVGGRVASLNGYRATDLKGKPFLSIVLEQDLERTRYTLERVSQGACSLEVRLVGRDESAFRHFDVSLLPIDASTAVAFQGNVRDFRIYGVARDISEKILNSDRLAYLAFHDILTGLPNRALFCDRVGLAMVQAKRSGLKIAAMFIDLDRFKLANDSFGHQKGDELLRDVARRLQEGLRETDTLARIGGDEFTVLLPGLRCRDDAACVASKLVTDMMKPFALSGEEVILTASIGIAIFPDDGEDIETLLRHADIAMYHVKSHGKNGAGFFADSMGEASNWRQLSESDIKHGIDADEFNLHYQPQVDASTGKIAGLEALSRWQHPSRGLMLAGSFISAIEEIGLMPEFTYRALETACRDLQSWRRLGYDMPCVSVNVSPRVLEHDDFLGRLLVILNEHGIPRENLEIEITESALVGDHQKVTDRLRRLSQERIRIAIDGLGTQHFSLSNLRYLPVSTLKVDPSFVREIERVDDSSPIVRAIVAIAAGLGLNVIAKGVETEVQAEFLRRLGCRQLQGHLFGQPLPTEEITLLLPRKDS